MRSLLPPGGDLTAAELVEGAGLWHREGGGGPATGQAGDRTATGAPRPRVLLNMVASADGHATLAGRSGGLSSAADRELFHALRLAADAVLVGAGTVRTERYGRIVRDAERRRERAERGLPEEPLACIVSASLRLDASLPLLADPQARVMLLTAAGGEIAGAGAHVSYLRCERGGELDLAAALARLRADFGVELVLCEGGPHLAGQLLAHGLL